MKPEQVRERLEMFGLGLTQTESDVFLKSVCDDYEEIYYALIEKDDKISALNDAIRYYKNMEDTMKQMLAAISDITEKAESSAQKEARLTLDEAKNQADKILADASWEAERILEDAKREVQQMLDGAEADTASAKKEYKNIQKAAVQYAENFYLFLEEQKAFFEEHRIDRRSAKGSFEFRASKKQDSVEVTPETSKNSSFAEMSEIQASVDIPDVQVPVDIPDVQMPVDIPDVQVPMDMPEIKIDMAAGAVVPEEIQHEVQKQVQHEMQRRTKAKPETDPVLDHTETLDEIIRSINKKI